MKGKCEYSEIQISIVVVLKSENKLFCNSECDNSFFSVLVQIVQKYSLWAKTNKLYLKYWKHILQQNIIQPFPISFYSYLHSNAYFFAYRERNFVTYVNGAEFYNIILYIYLSF